MIKINENYLKLQASYLFSEIRRRTDEFQEANADKDIIKLGMCLYVFVDIVGGRRLI